MKKQDADLTPEHRAKFARAHEQFGAALRDLDAAGKAIEKAGTQAHRLVLVDQARQALAAATAAQEHVVRVADEIASDMEKDPTVDLSRFRPELGRLAAKAKTNLDAQKAKLDRLEAALKRIIRPAGQA